MKKGGLEETLDGGRVGGNPGWMWIRGNPGWVWVEETLDGGGLEETLGGVGCRKPWMEGD